MKTQKERLMKFIAYCEMSKSAFERAAGLSSSSLIHAGNELTEKMMDKICLAFPNLNPEWLRTGDGIMLRDGSIIASPIFTNSGNNVQNEQNVISKEIIEMLKADNREDENLTLTRSELTYLLSYLAPAYFLQTL